MPFSDTLSKKVYENNIKPLCNKFKLKIRNASEIFSNKPIYDDIVREITTAVMVIVDISGQNANVFYELGIAHSLKQTQTIVITHDSYHNTPFNIAHFRILRYSKSSKDIRQFEKDLEAVFKYTLLDLKSIYKDEYELTLKLMQSTNHEKILFALIGLSKYPHVLFGFDPLQTEGHVGLHCSGMQSSSAEAVFRSLILMDYITTKRDQLIVTQKGLAFVNFLEEKGYVCDMFNKTVFTEGYIPKPFKSDFNSRGIWETSYNLQDK